MGNTFLLDFADYWPFFLSNNLLIEELIKMSSSSLIREQSLALKILSSKNMLHPKLINDHFEALMKLTDKNSVKAILNDFLHTCAYVGFTSGFDMQKLTQTMRRIYKSPQDVDSISTVLDFCIMLALSNAAYEEFDIKSRDFIEGCL